MRNRANGVRRAPGCRTGARCGGGEPRPPLDFQIETRGELGAGDGSALAIACTADADLIKIAPQRRPNTAQDLSRVAVEAGATE